MNKYFECELTGIHAPTIQQLKTKLVDYYFDNELPSVDITNITVSREIIIKSKTKLKQIAKILDKTKDNDEVLTISIFKRNLENSIHITSNVCDKGLRQFQEEAQDELDRAYKEIGGKFNDCAELQYERGL